MPRFHFLVALRTPGAVILSTVKDRVVTIAILFTLTATAAHAQQLRGTITDSASHAPIPSAVVLLLDSTGHASARTLTNDQGQFRLALTPAAATLRVVRIGFHPLQLALIPNTNNINLIMAALPQLLTTISTSDQSICPARPDRVQALGLWEQARDGLLATVVARETNPAQMRMLLFERTLDVHGAPVVRQTVHTDSGMSARPFVASRPAEAFAHDGYLEDEGDRIAFDGPDADVLVDPSFAATHCFQIQSADARHAGEIGLVFVPAPGRDTLVDVSGVLWMNRATPALVALDYRYTGLEPAAQAAGAGGALRFRTMPNGLAFVEYWSLRIASLDHAQTHVASAFDRPNGRFRTQQHDLVVTNLTETGGQVAAAAWPDGLTWEATLAQISGTVTTHDGHQPAGHVRVWLDGAEDDTTMTAGDGRYTLRAVLPGPWTLMAADTMLASYGVGQTASRAVDAVAGYATEVNFEIGGRGDAKAAACGGQRLADSTTVLLVRVITADGIATRGDTVEATWEGGRRAVTQQTTTIGSSARRGVTDATGRYAVCGVGYDQAIEVRVTHHGAVTPWVTVHVARGRTLGGVTIQLDRGSE